MALPSTTPTDPPGRGKPSTEHVVLGVVLAVVLIAAGWFLLKPGSGPAAKAAARPVTPAAAPASVAPVVATPTAKPLTAAQTRKAVFFKAANAICARKVAALNALGPQPAQPKQAAILMAKGLAISEHALAALRSLHPPLAEQARLKLLYEQVAMINAFGAGAEIDLKAGDVKAARIVLAAMAAKSIKTKAAFHAYGLTSC